MAKVVIYHTNEADLVGTQEKETTIEAYKKEVQDLGFTVKGNKDSFIFFDEKEMSHDQWQVYKKE